MNKLLTSKELARVKDMQPRWEKGDFYLAKYKDEVHADARKRQEESSEQSIRVKPSNSATVAPTNVEDPCMVDAPSRSSNVLMFTRDTKISSRHCLGC